MDATRDQVIAWCKSNGADFKNATHPAPNGWMWAMEGDGLILTAVFTNTCDRDVTVADIALVD